MTTGVFGLGAILALAAAASAGVIWFGYRKVNTQNAFRQSLISHLRVTRLSSRTIG